jgi:hypothetical protein
MCVVSIHLCAYFGGLFCGVDTLCLLFQANQFVQSNFKLGCTHWLVRFVEWILENKVTKELIDITEQCIKTLGLGVRYHLAGKLIKKLAHTQNVFGLNSYLRKI